ncbi:toxin VasX [Pseudomonas bharatica]|uniref:toxin VasX n=1 Tax=Pseudomonas bharatica TaxID=2692112 RepID=UPI00030F93C8|nr:toxin VasX [Pseudomonas bharatica]
MNDDTNCNLALALDACIEQADPVPNERCKTCQRWGLPILPLRAAYAPEPWQTQARPVSHGSDVKAVRMVLGQPRILRRGFLYVLLDRKYWQAYQITPEGVLRQFPAFQVPRQEPVPLSRICFQQDHDIPASSSTSISTGTPPPGWPSPTTPGLRRCCTPTSAVAWSTA